MPLPCVVGHRPPKFTQKLENSSTRGGPVSTYCGKTEVDDRKLKQTDQAPNPRLKDLYRIALGWSPRKNLTFIRKNTTAPPRPLFCGQPFSRRSVKCGAQVQIFHIRMSKDPTVPNVSWTALYFGPTPMYFGPRITELWPTYAT